MSEKENPKKVAVKKKAVKKKTSAKKRDLRKEPKKVEGLKRGEIKKRSTSLRAATNRRIRQEALREQLQAHAFIQGIEKDYKELADLDKSVKDAKNTINNPAAVSAAIHKAEARTKILKVKLDTNFRRLNKVLPDLKSVELTDPNDNSPFKELADVFRRAMDDGRNEEGKE